MGRCESLTGMDTAFHGSHTPPLRRNSRRHHGSWTSGAIQYRADRRGAFSAFCWICLYAAFADFAEAGFELMTRPGLAASRGRRRDGLLHGLGLLLLFVLAGGAVAALVRIPNQHNGRRPPGSTAARTEARVPVLGRAGWHDLPSCAERVWNYNGRVRRAPTAAVRRLPAGNKRRSRRSQPHPRPRPRELERTPGIARAVAAISRGTESRRCPPRPKNSGTTRIASHRRPRAGPRPRARSGRQKLQIGEFDRRSGAAAPTRSATRTNGSAQRGSRAPCANRMIGRGHALVMCRCTSVDGYSRSDLLHDSIFFPIIARGQILCRFVHKRGAHVPLRRIRRPRSSTRRVAQFRDQTRRFLAGELTEDEFRPLRLQNGLYIQKHAPMLRIAIPYGLLSTTQLRTLAHIARTVRPRLRPLHHAPEPPAQLAAARGRAGHPRRARARSRCTRSRRPAIACATSRAIHCAGVAGDEIVDPRPWCRADPPMVDAASRNSRSCRASSRSPSPARPTTAPRSLVHDIGVQAVRNEAGDAASASSSAAARAARR